LIKKDTQWFRSWFNSDYYRALYKHRDGKDAAKIISLLFKNIQLKKGSRVLDLACGNGRHSVFFARKGYETLGIDLSENLVAQARKMAAKIKSPYSSRLSFEIGDMRKLSHLNEFELVVNLFSSFGYFESDSENEMVIKSVSNSLKSGGYFLLDFLNAEYLKKNIVPITISGIEGNTVVQIRQIDNGFVKKEILIIEKSPNGKTYKRDYNERIKLYSRDDFVRMFTANGLKIVNVFGDYEGTKFVRSKSERLVLLARKQ